MQARPIRARLRVLTRIIAGLGLLSLLVVTNSCRSPSPGPIKIGALYNLEGTQASLDVPSYNGAKLAVKQLNQKGGINGRRVELVFYDGKTDEATIKEAARRLVENDRVSAVTGFSDSDMVLAAAPILAASKTVFITSGATSPLLPEQVKDYLFLACFGDNEQAAAGAEYAYNNLGFRTSALLVDTQSEYTTLLARYFKTRFEGMGGKIVLEDTYEGGAKDFSSQINRLKTIEPLPDMVYVASGPDDIGEIVKQLRQSNLNMPLMGGDGYDTPLLIQTAGEYADGVYFTTHVLLDDNSGMELIRQFIGAYESEYKRLPESAFAALGYDAVNVLADALGRANPDNPESIISSLLKIRNFPAVTGNISYENGSRIPLKGVSVVEVNKGRSTLAAIITPQVVPAP